MTLPKKAAGCAAVLALAAAEPSRACDLKLVPWHLNGAACTAVVGFYNGAQVGPYHQNDANGTQVYAGTCPGFIGVSKIEGSTIYLEAFNNMPPRVISLSDDCKSSIRLK